jgi:hypothetical protein
VINLRSLTSEGLRVFTEWLEQEERPPLPPALKDGDYTEEVYDGVTIDPGKVFSTRYEFGEYLNERLGHIDFHELRSAKNDGLWAWLAVIYLQQLAPNRFNKPEHYVIRKGVRGSLAYRQGPRSAFELVRIHGECARVCLGVPMDRWGEMAEQLTGYQNLAHHRGFFQAAYSLYYKDGKLPRGASSRPKKVKDRKLGDRSGYGGVRRLATALRRLDLTFDTEIMGASSMIDVLPREFNRWARA